MNKKRQFGLFLAIVGILVILSSISGITGSVVSNVLVGKSLSTFIGLIFIIGGLVLFEIGESQLVTRMIRTPKFKKAIKKHSLKPIQAAINKIGTGLGKPEKLTHLRGYSIRTNYGGRIMYKQDGNTVTLIDYQPPSKHY